MPMPDFMLDFLKQSYGAQKLVDEYASSVISTMQHYRKLDVRCPPSLCSPSSVSRRLVPCV